jgi:tetratricopeptide (TPR) repeat protein
LEAQPGDPIASGLRPGTKARLFRSRATLLAGQGDYEGAQRTLESALRDSPDDKETIELRDALRLKQTQEAKAQFEARVQNVIGQARAAAGRRDFDKAVEYLEEAERLSPADATIGRLQAEIAVERLRNLTPAEAKKQDEELIEHANQFRTVWAQALRENGSTEVFLTKYWESTKTVRDIRKALQEMGAKTSTFQVSNLSAGSRFYFTAKVGALKPPIQDGFYFVVGVLARAGGKVDISAKVYAYNPVAGSPVAETNKEVLQERLERLRSRLSEELGTPIY